MGGPALDRMRAQIEVWDAMGDGRAVFLDCYSRMTEAVAAAIAADRFVDAAWVSALVDRFAGYYFDSIDGGDRQVPVPEPWVLAHAAAVGNDASALQLLLAGVNAHINYDLVLTLVDLLGPEWHELDAARRAERRADYEVVNRIIVETADLVQDEVLERRAPALDIVDRALGRWDERAATRLLTAWRTRVWRDAMELLDENDERRAEHVAHIERVCARRARWLLL
jgi:hypothetical protein